jgi:biopolymer transport protein ExbB/TolQ
MAVPTTRELNVTVISVVTFVLVILMAAIVYAAQTGFFYFQNRQVERQYARSAAQVHEELGTRHDNLELGRLEVEHEQELRRTGQRDLTDEDGNVTGQARLTPIDQAMQQIAERY